MTAIRSGRRAGEYTHINQDMLKDGGYFDMPIQVRLSSGRPGVHRSTSVRRSEAHAAQALSRCSHWCLRVRNAGKFAHGRITHWKQIGDVHLFGNMQEAAQQLGIGLSVLKRVCRTIGLARWPFRKRQSLRNVMEQTKLYLHVRSPLSWQAALSRAAR